MDENKPFVITIVGAESSGKTTLAMQLAEAMECVWVPEYAREYLEKLGRDYDEKDLDLIAEHQLERILTGVSRQTSDVSETRESPLAPYPLILRLPDTHPRTPAQQPGGLSVSITIIKSKLQTPNSKIIIVDGGMMNLRMWAWIKYKTTIPIVEQALKNDVTDLYLLCRPRKEWTPDPLREAPTLLERAWIYNQYLDVLCRCDVPLEIISFQALDPL